MQTAPPPQSQQPKTVLGVVLLLLFGGLACCSGMLAIGSFGARKDALKKIAAGGTSDTGKKNTPTPTPPDDDGDDTNPPDDVDVPTTRTGELTDEEMLFATDVLAELGDEHPGFRLDELSFSLVNDKDAKLSLRNLYDEYAALPEEQQDDFLHHVAASLFPPELPKTWAEAKPKILATVRDRIFIELLTIRSDKAPGVLTRPLADDLLEVAVYDGADSMLYVTDQHLKDWGIDEATLFIEGRKHLAERSTTKKPFTSPEKGVWESTWADNHDVARALLFDTLRKLKVKGDPVIFLPQRDHLVVCGSDDPDAQDAAAGIIENYLELPRANTGRGWRVTKQGLEPFLPPANTELAELRLKALAGDANEQKKALDEKFTAQGKDLFVGSTLFTEDDDGKTLTYAVWTKDADTLMPKADFMVFVDIEREEGDRVVAAAPWADALPLVKSRMKEDPSYWPLRYRLKTFPDAKAIKQIGLHPYFARNKKQP